MSGEDKRHCGRCDRLLPTAASPCPRCSEATEQPITLPRPARLAAAGVVAGRYRIIRALGRGGFAHVHEALDLRLGRHVALKLLDAPLDSAAFEREGRALARLQHPHVVTVFDLVFDEHQQGLAMELVGGGSLASELSQGPLPWRRSAQIAAQVAAGLQHAHERRIAHGDVKPSNVLLDDAGDAKVSDFGTARIMESGTPGSSGFAGTLAYAAPEVLDGQRPQVRSDVFSLGCLLFESLTGRPPRTRGVHPTDAPALEASLGTCADIPASLVRLVVRCLSVAPQDRPGSCAEIEMLLRSLLGAELSASRVIPPDLRADLLPSAATGERRGLVVMQLARHHLDDIAEEWGAERADALRDDEDAILVKHARRHGAFIEYMGREGFRLAFGVARRTESDADAAVACAFALRRALLERKDPAARFGIGIHVVRAVSASPSRPWHLQARGLQELSAMVGATGDRDILISSEARSACRRRLAVVATAVTLEGQRRHDPLEAFLLSDEAPDGAALRPLIGRQHEVGLLIGAAQEAEERRATLVTVEGPPGIGKTRLLQEAGTRLEGRGFMLLHAECLPLALQPPQHPLHELLVDARSAMPLDDVLATLTGAEEALLRSVGAGAPPSAEPGLGDKDREAALRVAMRRFLSAACERGPVALLVEDVHLLSATALDLLWSLVEGSSQRLLVVVSHRPGVSGPWAGSAALRAISLQVLAARQARELAASAAELEIGVWTDAIVERAEGNPLLVIELARAAKARAAGTQGATSTQDWPVSLQAAVAERLDRMSPDARLVLQVGAAVGREFDLDLVAAVMQAEGVAGEIRSLLDEARPGQLVALAWRGARQVGRFHHALIQDTIYDQLVPMRRRAIHERITDVLLEHPPAQGWALHDLLAHHRRGAGRDAEARLHFKQSALMLEQQKQARAALQRWDAFIEIGKGAPGAELLAALCSASRLAMHLDDFGGADARAQLAMTLAADLGVEEQAAAHHAAASAAHAQLRHEEALALAERATEFARLATLPELEAGSLVTWSRILAALGRTPEAIETLDAAESVGVPAVAGAIRDQRTRLYYNCGRHSDALESIDAQLELAAACSDERETVRLLAIRCPTLLALGRITEARDAASRALDMARHHGLRSTEAYSLSLLAHLALQRHEPRAAELRSGEALGLAIEIGNRWDAVVAMKTRSLALHDLGRLAEARTLVLSALEAIARAGLRRLETGVHLAASRIESTLGRWEIAERHGRLALDLAESQSDTLRQAEARSLLSEVYRFTDRVPDARLMMDAAQGNLTFLVREQVRLLLSEQRHDLARAANVNWINQHPDEAAVDPECWLLAAAFSQEDEAEQLSCARRALEIADAAGMTGFALQAARWMHELAPSASTGPLSIEDRIAACEAMLVPEFLASWRARANRWPG